MKLPKDDNDLRDDDRFGDDDREALFGSSDGSSDPGAANPVVNCCVSGIAYIQFLWIFRRLETILALVLFFSVTLLVTGVVETYESKKHNFKRHRFDHDYSEIKSSLELKLKDIDHWCLDGSDNTCSKCDDPTHPISRGEYDGWKEAFMRNVKLSNQYKRASKNPDVIFMGDSLVEATVGTMKGLPGLDETPAAKQLDKIKDLYDNKFSKANGSKYDVLRLGIAGDTSPNLFWRLRQNEMRDLTPAIWWISIGRNDLFRTKCSEEVTLMGIIRVIEEIDNRNDGSTIVINSLLPTTNRVSMQLEGGGSKNDMWKSIKEINGRLKKFAQRHDHVVFYDANDVFVETRGKKKFITKSLYADKLHPNYAGYKALSNNQMAYIDHVMDKRASAQDKTSTAVTTPQEKSSQSGTTAPTKKKGPSNVDGDFHEDFEDADDYYGYVQHFTQDDLLQDFNLFDDIYGTGDDDW